MSLPFVTLLCLLLQHQMIWAILLLVSHRWLLLSLLSVIASTVPSVTTLSLWVFHMSCFCCETCNKVSTDENDGHDLNGSISLMNLWFFLELAVYVVPSVATSNDLSDTGFLSHRWLLLSFYLWLRPLFPVLLLQEVCLLLAMLWLVMLQSIYACPGCAFGCSSIK